MSSAQNFYPGSLPPAEEREKMHVDWKTLV